MDLSVALVFCAVLGGNLAYDIQRAPYYLGPNDPYAVNINSNLIQEPSQRLFWDKFGNNGQGSNQVGGTGIWGMLTSKFPFLGNMFGKMELPAAYGPPGYQQQPLYYSQQYVPNQRYQQQWYSQQAVQQLPYYRQPYTPGVRNVAVTDDAVIVTPPHVPVFPAGPAPAPAPAPIPAPEPSPQGYQYNKPQRKLELPYK